MKKLLLPLTCLVILSNIINPATAARLHPEEYYVDWWCSMYGGEQEFTFPNGTRADCLLPHVAVEADFADKWYEGVGQALHYGLLARRAPGIVLTMEDYENEYKYFMRLKRTIRSYNLDVRVFPIFVDEGGEPYEGRSVK